MPKTPILDLVIEVMEQVAKENRKMFMYKYYQFNAYIDPGATELHTCGTAACICGYAALHKSLRNAMGFRNAVEHPTDLPDAIWNKVAEEITREAADSCFHGFADERSEMAFTVPWLRSLRSHPHLKIDNPTAEQALDYLKQVRTAFENK